MPDQTIFISALGIDRPQSTNEKQAALTAFQADRQREAALLAAIPPNELTVLRQFHGNSPAALIAAWDATQRFAQEKARAQRQPAEVALVPERRCMPR